MHAAADLRDDVDDVLQHAHVRGRRRKNVQQQDERRDADDRDDDDDQRRVVPRQPLELEEDQPDEERVDAEQQASISRPPPAPSRAAGVRALVSRSRIPRIDGQLAAPLEIGELARSARALAQAGELAAARRFAPRSW